MLSSSKVCPMGRQYGKPGSRHYPGRQYTITKSRGPRRNGSQVTEPTVWNWEAITPFDAFIFKSRATISWEKAGQFLFLSKWEQQ